jgi:type IV pilus assembly protein PilE
MATPFPSRVSRQSGFTLIELMVTVVIATILLSIAVPAYTSQVRKSRRTDARTAVLDLAGREERFFSISNNYSQTATDLGYAQFPATVGGGYYNVSVQAPDPTRTPPVQASFRITATAIGPQLNDTQCNSFTVDSLGQQTAFDSGGNPSTQSCWN